MDEAGSLEPIGSLRVDAPASLDPGLLPESPLLRTRFPDAPLFGHLPWAMGAFPLVIHDEAIGLWALGPKHPDQPFDAREVEFLAAAANAGAVAAENMRLFEALREMSQNVMQAAASERRALASRIHDDPLQLTARMVDDLSVAMRDRPAGAALGAVLTAQVRGLQTLSRGLRDICAGLRPPILGQGLQFTLRELARTFERDHSIPTSLEFRCDPEPDLPDRALEAVYHVVTEALNVELADRQHDEVRRFSRGMQQKLAVAVALLHDPEVLLLDEPTLGLDVQAARTLETTIARLAGEQGKAVLLTAHQMPLAEKLSNRVMVMRRGEAVACDRTSTLLSRFSDSSFEIQLADAASGPRALASLAGVNSTPVLGENGTLVWKHIGQSQAVAALARLDTHGIAVECMGRRAATLEEVYLALTGENGATEPATGGDAA